LGRKGAFCPEGSRRKKCRVERWSLARALRKREAEGVFRKHSARDRTRGQPSRTRREGNQYIPKEIQFLKEG